VGHAVLLGRDTLIMTSFPGSRKGIYLASMNPAMNVSRPSASLLASAARRWTASASSTSYEKNVQCFKHIQQSLAEVQMALASRPPGRAADKLTTWEKVQLIRDQGAPLLQLSPLAGYWTPYGKVANAGMLSAVTRVAGRSCMILANDWAHKGGTVFPITLKKQLRAQEVAAQNDLPCVYIVDSGGAFLPLQVGAFTGSKCACVVDHACVCVCVCSCVHRQRYSRTRSMVVVYSEMKL